ncbi:MAG TPA: PfkB family carbohydrate kinase, partial [Candidatus Acidoferrales bacterium]|nr:PfkB family carbohydrate kinase [Candidatus Acidoferrales bacterium]
EVAMCAAPRYAFPANQRFDVVGFGLNSVDHLCVVKRQPRLDSKQQLVTYDVQPGGQVPTALVALQRWGLRTAYVGGFGDDTGGVLSRTSLATEGVDISATVTRRDARQQVSVILIDEGSGERSVLWQRVDELVLRPEEVPQGHLAEGRVLLMDAVDVPTAIDAARRAKRAGILTVLDTDTPAAGIGELLQLTDVLIVAAEFPGRLTGVADLRAAMRQTAKRGPWFVGVTLGPGGALALVHGELRYVPAFRVPVVDTTGAGDIFHAGAIYGLLHAWSVEATLRFAAAAAALKCERLGGRPGIPTLERALELARLR